jgi:hypothetical protein
MNDATGLVIILLLVTLYFLWKIKHYLEDLNDGIYADLREILRLLKEK